MAKKNRRVSGWLYLSRTGAVAEALHEVESVLPCGPGSASACVGSELVLPVLADILWVLLPFISLSLSLSLSLLFAYLLLVNRHVTLVPKARLRDYFHLVDDHTLTDMRVSQLFLVFFLASSSLTYVYTEVHDRRTTARMEQDIDDQDTHEYRESFEKGATQGTTK